MVVVDVDDAHAVTNAESWVAVQALSTWAGVTNAGTSELGTLESGVGQTGPVPPLLEPLLLPEPEPDELPELEPDELPELDPEEPPELDPEPLPLPLPDPLLEPELLPLPLPDPLLDPELLPLPDPEPFMQAWLAARVQDVVSAHEAQLKVCAPTVKYSLAQLPEPSLVMQLCSVCPLTHCPLP